MIIVTVFNAIDKVSHELSGPLTSVDIVDILHLSLATTLAEMLFMSFSIAFIKSILIPRTVVSVVMSTTTRVDTSVSNGLSLDLGQFK